MSDTARTVPFNRRGHRLHSRTTKTDPVT